ncbi:MAG: transcriptional regulator [Actinobacteria bacterium]|nr:transcriptional regulator [Actinomycetota bacterium]|tara:strand:- start:1030 stop:1548 length:519 start_codon:yes stop_codon:yes gene_type:complete
MEDELDALYRRRVGERIRVIRRQQRLSLHDVEDRSESEFKASVLGAYERGERAISVPRLQRLARFYGVPVDQLLPAEAESESGISNQKNMGWAPGQKIVIDLTKLIAVEGPEAEMIERYLTIIQVKRQDFNGRVLTIRGDDLQALAAILGTDVDAAAPRLDELGLLYRPDAA